MSGKITELVVFTSLLTVLDAVIMTYLVSFFAINFYFAYRSWRAVSRHLGRDTWHPPEVDRKNPFLPVLTLLVPAYNEEVTCIESVSSLLKLDYPAYEIVICNDGSKDNTVQVLIEAFKFVRADIDWDSSDI